MRLNLPDELERLYEGKGVGHTRYETQTCKREDRSEILEQFHGRVEAKACRDSERHRRFYNKSMYVLVLLQSLLCANCAIKVYLWSAQG